MEMEIFLQDSENLRENLTCVIREEGGYYPEELGFIVNRGFKSRGKEKSNKEYQVRTQKNKGTVQNQEEKEIKDKEKEHKDKDVITPMEVDQREEIVIIKLRQTDRKKDTQIINKQVNRKTQLKLNTWKMKREMENRKMRLKREKQKTYQQTI